MSRKHSNIILVGIIAGVILALFSVWVFGEKMSSVKVIGDFFLRALRMIIVPLVVASVVHGVTRMGDIRKLGGVGIRTVGYYACTTALSVMVGIILVTLIRPGEGMVVEGVQTYERAQAKVDAGLGLSDIVLSLVSPNIINALSEADMLPVILFSLLFGGVLTTLGTRGEPVIALFDGLNDAMMKIVHLIMWIAPIGIFGLVAAKFGAAAATEGGIAGMMAGIGKYMGTVLTGLGIHAFITLPLICLLLSRKNPLAYIAAMFPALLTAWSTASSSATIPVTLDCAQERGGVGDRASGFVIPLGATINMDGTALYEAVAAVFIAQAYGVDLTSIQLFLVFLTATLVSIGAAGIPEAGLFMMVIVLEAVGLPLEGTGLIFTIDWLLDRFRTATNVWGDSVGAAYIDRVI